MKFFFQKIHKILFWGYSGLFFLNLAKDKAILQKFHYTRDYQYLQIKKEVIKTLQ